MARVTRGTEIWFIDPSDDSLVKLVCPTAITGLDAPREQIETTCLEDQARSYESGLATPGQASITVQFDPAEPSHVALYDLWTTGAPPSKWAIGWSDGITPPTVAAAAFVFPTTRTFSEFEATVNSVPFDFSLNAVVQSTIALQISGMPTLHPKA